MAKNDNIAAPSKEPDWGNTAPAWVLPGWAEPVVGLPRTWTKNQN